MASSSATTRSAWSRSPVDEGLGAGRDRVERERREAHDVERTSSTRSGPADRTVGHDLRGDHVLDHGCRPAESRVRCRSDCLPAVHLRATTRPRRVHDASVRSARRRTSQSTFQEEHPHASFVHSSRAASCSPRWRCRCWSLGTAATAATPSQAKLASATLNGDGSTFQLGFNQVCHRRASSSSRRPSRSTTRATARAPGRTDFVNGSSTSPAPTPPYKSTDPQPPKPFLYFPTVVAPITVSYNLEGVKLKLSPETTAKIFSGADHDLGRRRDQDRQPEGQAARARRSRSCTAVDCSGTTAELHQLADQGGAHRLDARQRLDRELAVRARRAPPATPVWPSW